MSEWGKENSTSLFVQIFFFNNKTIKLNIKLKGRTERDREALFDSQFASEARKYTEREQCSTSGKM